MWKFHRIISGEVKKAPLFLFCHISYRHTIEQRKINYYFIVRCYYFIVRCTIARRTIKLTLYTAVNFIYRYWNVKCDKIKIKLGIDREKSGFIHLDELSNYYFARSFVAREIKYLEFIAVNKATLYYRSINSYYLEPENTGLSQNSPGKISPGT